MCYQVQKKKTTIFMQYKIKGQSNFSVHIYNIQKTTIFDSENKNNISRNVRS